MTIIKALLFLLCSALTTSSIAQISLRNISKFNSLRKDKLSEDYSPIKDSVANINYIIPFLNYYSNFLKNKQPIDNRSGQLSQLMAIMGCYKQATDLILEPSRKPGNSARLQISEFVNENSKHFKINADPIKYIIDQAKGGSITMINEAHDHPRDRVFVMSLLPKLKVIGYKYLAMETLTNISDSFKNKHLLELSQQTGYYTCEPVFGELVRYALELGYILVPYEHVPINRQFDMNDTVQFAAMIHERDSMQAVNLIKARFNYKDGKMLVLGGYAHTLEATEDLNGNFNPFRPMALYFKELTHIDPFTINQTQFSETDKRIGGLVYEELCKKEIVNKPVCIEGDDTTLFGAIVQSGLSDTYTMLPKSTYINDRPTWLMLNGLRKRYKYTFPKKVMDSLILIQAYYQNEVADEKTINQKVPADQFMLIENNNVDFYLRPGFSYLVVCRDINNKIIYKKGIKAQ
jgi:hypothetical protein